MLRKPAFVLLSIVLLSSCSFSRQVERRSSLMSYLYPQATDAPAPPVTDAKLQLPLRIGVAFVPPDDSTSWCGSVDRLFPPGAEKKLTEIVARSFAGRPWVSQIRMLPSSYLVPHGGFKNLEQVARLMNVDVVALVSVDQLQTSDPRRVSFLYLSVIGAYVLPLDHNETRTLIDAAVFHVPTRTFLLRAPGVSSVTGNSTAVDVRAALSERSVRGFGMAMKDLAKNLDTEVDLFKTSVVAGERQDIDIVSAKGESFRHGGAVGMLEGLIACVFLLAILVRRRP
jgi:rhombotail lipoprotein